MKKLTLVLILNVWLSLISAMANAATGELTFKSVALNDAVAIFNRYSKELVEKGEVSVAYCGSYGAYFMLKKYNVQDLARDFIINPGAITPHQIEYVALELSEEKVQQLAEELDRHIFYHQHDLSIGSLSQYRKEPNGLILNFSAFTSTAVLWDVKTQEYFTFGGSSWQDDCD